jgi:hypothetical protein
MDYTKEEITFLLAGLQGLTERDAIWQDPSYQAACDRLIDLRLIVTGDRPNAMGLTGRIPLGLSPQGIADARRLRDLQTQAR